jgi:hypothetical protein
MDLKEQYQALKLFGLAGRMRKHQKNYFKSRNNWDKTQAIKYEKLLDEYLRLLLKEGWQPIFEDNVQQKIF